MLTHFGSNDYCSLLTTFYKLMSDTLGLSEFVMCAPVPRHRLSLPNRGILFGATASTSSWSEQAEASGALESIWVGDSLGARSTPAGNLYLSRSRGCSRATLTARALTGGTPLPASVQSRRAAQASASVVVGEPDALSGRRHHRARDLPLAHQGCAPPVTLAPTKSGALGLAPACLGKGYHNRAMTARQRPPTIDVT